MKPSIGLSPLRLFQQYRLMLAFAVQGENKKQNPPSRKLRTLHDSVHEQYE